MQKAIGGIRSQDERFASSHSGSFPSRFWKRLWKEVGKVPYEDYVLSHGCPELRMDTNARNVAAKRAV